MIRSIALLALASAAALAAQTTTINIFVPFADEQPLVGSIIGVDSTAATTLAIGCPPGTDSNDCGFWTSQTITQGPSTLAFAMTFVPEDLEEGDGPYTEIAGCQLNLKSSSALCSVTMISTTDGTITTTSATMDGAELPSPLSVVITAGAEKLTASPGASETATASATGSSTTAATTGPKASSVSPSSSLSTTTTTSFSNSTATASDSTPTTTHVTAAGSANTRNMILAGVAALVGAVMVL